MCPVFAFLDNPLLMIFLGALAVMLFGERLPEVARTWGKGLMELKKGVRNIQDEIHGAINSAVDTSIKSSTSSSASPHYEEPADREEATGPKFEPPPSAS
jgi:sec-independent protein translocase protein TatA